MRKVQLDNGHVVNVYWIDTVYGQNNLPTEFSKGQFSLSKEKYAKLLKYFMTNGL